MIGCVTRTARRWRSATIAAAVQHAAVRAAAVRHGPALALCAARTATGARTADAVAVAAALPRRGLSAAVVATSTHGTASGSGGRTGGGGGAAAAGVAVTANGLADAEGDLLVLDEIRRSDALLQALSAAPSPSASPFAGGAAATNTPAGQQNAMAQAKALLLRALDVVRLIPGPPPMRVNAGLRLARVHAWRAEFADETAERQRVLTATEQQLRAALTAAAAAAADGADAAAAADRAAALALLLRRCVLSLAYCHLRAGESVRVTQLLTHYASLFASAAAERPAAPSASAPASAAAAAGAAATADDAPAAARAAVPQGVRAAHAESAVWCRLLLAYSVQCSLLEKSGAAAADKREAVLSDLEGGVQFLLTECERQCKQYNLSQPQLTAAIAIHRGALAGAVAAAAAGAPGSATAGSALAKRLGDAAVKSFAAAVEVLRKDAPDSPLLPSALCAVGMLRGEIEPLKEALAFSEKHYGSTDARVAVVLLVMARYYLKKGDPVASEGLYRSAMSYYRAHRPFTAAVAYGFAVASAEHSLRLLPKLTWNQRNRADEGLKLYAHTRSELAAAFGGRTAWLPQPKPAASLATSAAAPAAAASTAAAAAPDASELSPYVAARNAGWLRQLYYAE